MPHPSFHARSVSVSRDHPSADTHESRPKFSRRPASFSQPAHSDSPAPIALATSKPPLADAPQRLFSPWQEDLRFGVLLMTLLLLVNLVLSYAIPALAPPAKSERINNISAMPMAMPQATRNSSSVVTTFAQPVEQQTIRQQLDLRTSDKTHALSIAPDAFPPPKAQPLDLEQDTDSQ